MSIVNEKAPLVSVLMPTYNHEQFISEAINSVLGQTYQCWELIIIDDGSTDRTREEIRKLMNLKANGRVQLLIQSHKGPSHLSVTYNNALKYARGELLAILEGDDVWPPAKLEVQVSDFADPRIVLSFGNYGWIDSKGNDIRTIRLSRYLPAEVLANDPVGIAAWYMAGLAYRTFAFPCTVVLRRSVLEAIGGFQGLPGPVNLVDFPTFLELSLKGRFVYHDFLLGYWRRRLSSLTTTYNEGLTRAARDYALYFLAEHPECREGEDSRVYASWARVLPRVRFTKARAHLIAGEWGQAARLFRTLMREKGVPFELRAAAVCGLLASGFHTDLESLMQMCCGYSLRGMRD